MSLNEAQLIEWRRELHTWPELSGQEFATTARLRQWLQNAGIRLLDYPLETGVVAEIGSGENLIALRADIDALPIHEASGVSFHSRQPGVMHACGHDLHSAVMLGAALELQAQQHQLRGRVRILFQPAEEIARGARQFIQAGVLDQVQAIFGMHNEPGLPSGTFATRGGAFYANADKFVIHVTGKGAHAAHPEQGVDAIVVASQIIQALQALTSRSFNALDSLVLSITRVDGGRTWNVLPETVEFGGTARTHDLQLRAELEKRVRTLVENIALANGAQASLRWHAGPPVLVNDANWAQFSSEVARQVGYRVQTADLHLGGEDFAFYLQQVPGAFVSIGSASDFGLHHAGFTPDESSIAPAAHYFAQLARQALDHLHDRCREPALN
ncbi:amidohydrolase [Pantoea ananatis]|uniref:amidohydrolase n=1 Tax=Pantoea ananas TaxID=553 RepID=UPI000D73C559|nr:amidohydrolase [Pantoea ananatis]AWQ17453.1 amidohydrolase [Pantoea ananatis]MBN6030245.1 amidohydrolase [Pantoea ananatis]MCW0316839.1 N-acetylcysteine deacetylase [Pantoea ananatis]MCW0331069.1 N-acetylcysteine deacetylase [Pantoea ananatis]MCW0334960.1 N-acetylcysteine deacetylase [Pantoea ananatis]